MSDATARGLLPGTLVEVPGHAPFVVVAHEPDGLASVRAVGGAPSGVTARNDLAAVPLTAADVAALESRALAWRHSLVAHGGINELRLTPVAASHSSAARRLVIHSALSDFAAHAAAREFVARAEPTRKRLWYSAGICPPLSHGLATSIAVITADLQLLLTRRSDHSLAGGTWDVGIGEGQSVEDVSVDVDGRLVWQPMTTARRALHEELSVRRVHHLDFHTLAVNTQDGSTSLFAVAVLPYSFDELVTRAAQRTDEELVEFDAVPWSLEAVHAVLAERELAPWAAAKLLTAAVFCAGLAAVERTGLLPRRGRTRGDG